MVMAAIGVLADNPDPSDREVREGLEGNLCRCTGYHNIVRAVLAASGQDAGKVHEDDTEHAPAGGLASAPGFSTGSDS
jgi:carbon-monoxide dehydrogenase small subunit